MGVGPAAPAAVIFDLDGVLIDSEVRWPIVEAHRFSEIGVDLSPEDTKATIGLRIDEVVDFWAQRRPWDEAAPGRGRAEVADAIIDDMVRLAIEDPVAVSGALDAVERLARAGFRLAVCSSSPQRLIAASLAGLGIAEHFAVVHSAEHEIAGKPHPACYLSTCAALVRSPHRCVAIEDSVTGAIAAAAAGCAVIAVPAPDSRADERFGFCAAVLDGMDGLVPSLIDELSVPR